MGFGIRMSIPRHPQGLMVLATEGVQEIEDTNIQIATPAGDRFMNRAPTITVIERLGEVGHDENRERYPRGGTDLVHLSNRLFRVSPFQRALVEPIQVAAAEGVFVRREHAAPEETPVRHFRQLREEPRARMPVYLVRRRRHGG